MADRTATISLTILVLLAVAFFGYLVGLSGAAAGVLVGLALLLSVGWLGGVLLDGVRDERRR